MRWIEFPAAAYGCRFLMRFLRRVKAGKLRFATHLAESVKPGAGRFRLQSVEGPMPDGRAAPNQRRQVIGSRPAFIQSASPPSTTSATLPSPKRLVWVGGEAGRS